MSEKNKALVRRTGEIWNQGDLSAAEEVYAADVVLHSSVAGERTGVEAVKQAIRAQRAAFPDLQVTIEHLIAEGDMVVNHVSLTGTHQGEFAGLAPSGKPWKATAISVVRVADGKVAEIWGVADQLDVLRGLGASPS
jgi:steroid delta-isomerase-like uncharacterized protein